MLSDECLACCRSLLAIDVQTPSRLTALSDSVMRHPALNDVTDSDHSYDSGKMLFSILF